MHWAVLKLHSQKKIYDGNVELNFFLYQDHIV